MTQDAGTDGWTPAEADWVVEGAAGRSTISAEEVDAASRAYWEATADEYQAEHGAFLSGRSALMVDSDDPHVHIDQDPAYRSASGAGFVWGPEGLTEAEAGLLGPVSRLSGMRVLEVGCGGAQCSQWLAAVGAHAIGIDISVNQLRHAQARVGSSDRGRCAVTAATATALPFAQGTFDTAFASYGAIQFVGDLPTLLGEVRRVLRPGGRWAFSVTHPIRWAFPDDPGPAGLNASGSYFDRSPYVERDASGAAVYAEFHRTVGDYVAALVDSGFVIETMLEPEWPDWNDATWGGWSPLRGTHLPGTLIFGCRADDDAGARPPD